MLVIYENVWFDVCNLCFFKFFIVQDFELDCNISILHFTGLEDTEYYVREKSTVACGSE